eukprot:CFRG4564T1
MKGYIVTLLLYGVSLCLAQTEQSFTIGMKTLILTSGSSGLENLPEMVLKSYGVEYDVVKLTEDVDFNYPQCAEFSSELCGTTGRNTTAVREAYLDLIDSDTDSPKYNSIIYTSSSLGYSTIDSSYVATWVQSALTNEINIQLDQYCKSYGVRTVVLNSNPSELGDAAIGSDKTLSVSGVSSDRETCLTFVQNSLAESMHNVLKENAKIRIGNEVEMLTNGTFWLWPADIDSVNNQDDHVQPLMYVDYSCPFNSSICQSIGAVVVTNPTSFRESLHFHFTASINGLHGVTLGHLWYPWVTRGLFMGHRQIILDTQIDDFFLDTIPYDTTDTYRITATDLTHHKELQETLTGELPPGSNFTIQMAFNGKGYSEFGNVAKYAPNLNLEAISIFDAFLWITHTWNHVDMYCLYSDCSPSAAISDPLFSACNDWTNGPCDYSHKNEPIYPASGYTPFEYNLYEITRNQYFADTVLNANGVNLSSFWSPKSIVTPRISGLNYTESIQAMLQAGIRFAVGDNSRTDLTPENLWHALDAQVLMGKDGVLLTDETKAAFESEMLSKFGVKSIKVLPRFASRIYYDVSLPEELAVEHNSFYGPRCYGYDQNEDISSGGWKCNSNSFKYDHDLTAEEVMALEGLGTAHNLLSLRTDPYMFHQVNLRTFVGNSGTESLLEQWIRATLRWVMEYTTFPILTYKMDDLAEVYRQRQERDECGLSGAVEYVSGKPIHLIVSSQNTCDAKLTYTTTQGSDLYKPLFATSRRRQAASDSNVDSTFTLPMSGEQVVVDLAGNPNPSTLPTTTPVASTVPVTSTSTTVRSTLIASPTISPSDLLTTSTVVSTRTADVTDESTQEISTSEVIGTELPSESTSVDSDSTSLPLGALIGIVVGGSLLLITLGSFVVYVCRRRKQLNKKGQGPSSIPVMTYTV